MAETAPGLRCTLLDTGSCTVWQPVLWRGAAPRFVRTPALAALLQHPVHGNILWDTGYAPRMLDETSGCPQRLYRWATPLDIGPDRSAAAQIAKMGLPPSSVSTVILSHFHADHIAGLRDFPSARIIVSKKAYTAVEPLHGLKAVRRAFLPGLLPEDFLSRAHLIDRFERRCYPELGCSLDLFDDGSLILFELPGHATGQLGCLAAVNGGLLFLAADSLWSRAETLESRPPHSASLLLSDNHAEYVATRRRLRRFALQNPDIIIVPSHCRESRDQWLARGAVRGS